jgi:hypothetical protein
LVAKFHGLREMHKKLDGIRLKRKCMRDHPDDG